MAGRSCGSLVVFAGQGVGNHAHQLLPGSLAVGSEVLAEVGSQDNDQDVTQELWGQEQPRVSSASTSPHKHSPYSRESALLNLPQALNLVSALALKVQVLLPHGKSKQKFSRVFWAKFFFVPSGFVLGFLSSTRPTLAQTRSSC